MSLFTYYDESEVETIEPVFKKVWSDEARANFKELRKQWSPGKKAKAEINGHLVKDLINQYGPTAPYHMKKYGHCDNVGKPRGLKKGNTNGRKRMIDGKSVSEWRRIYGVSAPRVVKWYEMHGTMEGCVAGKAGGRHGQRASDETRAKISAALKGKRAGENNPNFGKKHTAETRAKMSAAVREQWQKNAKVLWHTPYGVFKSAQDAAEAEGLKCRTSISQRCYDSRFPDYFREKLDSSNESC